MDNTQNVEIAGVGGGVCSRLFWKDDSAFHAEIVIAVLTHGNGQDYILALQSICEQKTDKSITALVLGDQNSYDWVHRNKAYLDKVNVVYAEVNANKVWIARNLAHQVIKVCFKSCQWICRLDSDDTLESENSISSVIESVKNSSAKWILTGNRQRKKGKLLNYINKPVIQLMNPEYLLKQLQKMAGGDFSAELPSCNLWIHADLSICYPSFESAEDHWLLVYLLLNDRQNGKILPECLFSVYSIIGESTQVNQKQGSYLAARKELLSYAEWVVNGTLSEKGRTVLGWGREGLVYCQEYIVCKNFYRNALAQQKINWLKHFPQSSFFPSFRISNEKDQYFISYPFEKSSACSTVTLAQLTDFIVECLTKRIVALNVARKNFRCIQEKLLFVDIGRDIVPLEIKYFRDMCARLFLLFVENWTDEKLTKHTIKLRTDISFLKSIDGFESFYARCFLKWMSKTGYFKKPPFTPVKRFVHLDVTLMIKVCAMEYDVIYRNLAHILTQMTRYEQFKEIIVLVDSREDDFLRQYKKGSLSKLIGILEMFKESAMADRILLTPDIQHKEIIKTTNMKWFGLDNEATRNQEGVPVFPQIWGFDQVKSPFLLQMDSDVIIHRGDPDYDVVGEMKQAVSANSYIFGAGFNIPQDKDDKIKQWDAQPGEFVPEVRFGLLFLERIFKMRPYPNSATENGLDKSWYRSIEAYQKKTGYRFLRGGRGSTYYIHTPNEFKKNHKFLGEVYDLVEQGLIPLSQRGKWDLSGKFCEWNYSHREEDIILVIICDKKDCHWTRSLLNSLKSQSYSSWGCICFNSAEDGLFKYWLIDEFAHHKSKVTFINQKLDLKNTREVFAKVCTNPRSMMILLNYNDCLVDQHVLDKITNGIKGDDSCISFGEYRFKDPIGDLTMPKSHSKIHGVRNSFIQNGSNFFEPWIKGCLQSNHVEKEVKRFNNFVIFTNRRVNQKHRKAKKRNTTYLPNILRIEIDLTYKCNLRCAGCSRSSAQAPEDLHIDIQMIDQFIRETEEKNINWDRIALLGGEPTLHPQFLEIVYKLDKWLQIHSPQTEVKVISNGIGSVVKDMLSKMPQRWFYDKSFKKRRKKGLFFDYFEPFNDAPIDDPEWLNEDFSKGCWITQDSGIGLTPFGYFPCAIAGGIERIMRLELGKKNIPQDSFELIPL